MKAEASSENGPAGDPAEGPVRGSAEDTAKQAIVTGANAGIGRVTALELARRGYQVHLACRSEAKAAPVVAAINEDVGEARAHFLALDLANFDSIHAAAERFTSAHETLDLLVNNAGLAGPYRELTRDGFQMTFGVNHLGHHLFTRLLEDALIAADHARIVNVASRAHYRTRGIDFSVLREPVRTRTGLPEYAVSKLANVLHAKKLARRLEGKVAAYALHPGVVASEVWRKVPAPARWVMKRFMITNEEGAQTSLHCATSAKVAGESGLYYDECAPKDPNPAALDLGLQDELWDQSETWVKPWLA